MGLDCEVARTRAGHIRLIRHTLAILEFILADVSQGVATTRRDPADGEKGWTVLEVVCHLRDFDRIFQSRVRQMLRENEPTLQAYDHERMAIEFRYNEQDLRTALAELHASRREFVALFEPSCMRRAGNLSPCLSHSTKHNGSALRFIRSEGALQWMTP